MSNNVLSIVAGGWSFAGFDHKTVPGQVIAVNDTLLHFTSELSYVVSMDRLWTENRWENLKRRAIPSYLRRSSFKNIHLADEGAGGWCEWLHTFECDREPAAPFGETFGQLNGRNSGACAINLAYVLRPRELYLFGFDMNRSPDGKAYWYPGYEWNGKGNKGATGAGKYAEWVTDCREYAKQFAAIGTKVWNVSPVSAIDAFPKISKEDLQCR